MPNALTKSLTMTLFVCLLDCMGSPDLDLFSWISDHHKVLG